MRHVASWVILALLISFCIPSLSAAATVELDRGEFVKLLANIDLLKQRLANADAQIVLHLKGRDAREKVISLQKEHIAELEGMIADYKAKGESMERLVEALEQKAAASKPWLNATSSFVLGILAAAVVFTIIH
ncbi:hypothetical protein [Nitrospira sp. BLG_1]|uniref:hypothetical protein n=1 Tax=Nitrospira sp. BLG_1 TaxID=3395883 RepID=UPI0039BC991B